jgi:hypothetical protein
MWTEKRICDSHAIGDTSAAGDHAGRERPRHAELPDVLRVDLVEAAESCRGVVLRRQDPLPVVLLEGRRIARKAPTEWARRRGSGSIERFFLAGGACKGQRAGGQPGTPASRSRVHRAPQMQDVFRRFSEWRASGLL